MKRWIVIALVLAVIAAAVSSRCLLSSCKVAKPKHNVIVILVDTLRADHLGYAGYERPTSPAIDALAAQSVNFQDTFGASSWTAPCVASLFTGLYPSIHGMMPPNSRLKAAQKFSFKLSGDLVTMAEHFKEGGYQTAGVSANEWISEQFGYTQGFDYFHMSSKMLGEAVNTKATRILDKVFKKDAPFFLCLHYMDPHDPYKAPGAFENYFEGDIKDARYDAETQKTLRAYDNEIRYADDQIGKLLEEMKRRKIYDDSYIIFTADHGEQFRERGRIGHGYTLFNEEIHIPFLIKFPNSSRIEKISAPASQVDILPTILGLIGISPSKKMNGINLFDTSSAKRERNILSEVSRKTNLKGVVKPNLTKIIGEYDVDKGLYVDVNEVQQVNAYALTEDPTETNPLTSDPSYKETLLSDFSSLILNYEKYKVDTLEMNSDTLEELKSLGYF